MFVLVSAGASAFVGRMNVGYMRERMVSNARLVGVEVRGIGSVILGTKGLLMGGDEGVELAMEGSGA